MVYIIYKSNYLKYSFKELSQPDKKGKVKVRRKRERDRNPRWTLRNPLLLVPLITVIKG